MSKISIEKYPIYSILDSAKKIAKHYNTSKDINEFQKQENIVLNRFLSYFLNEIHLFSAITHLKKGKDSLDADDKKAIQIYTFGNIVKSNKDVEADIVGILDDILDDIKNEKALSMTLSVLKEI